jgi:hypothetical protein
VQSHIGKDILLGYGSHFLLTKGAKEALKEIAHHYPVGIYRYCKETVLRDGHMSWGLKGTCVWECGDYENKMKTIRLCV